MEKTFIKENSQISQPLKKNKLKSEFKSDYCSTKVKDKKNMLKLEIAENKFLRSISEIKIRENEEKRRERNKSRRGRK